MAPERPAEFGAKLAICVSVADIFGMKVELYVERIEVLEARENREVSVANETRCKTQARQAIRVWIT